MNQYTLDDIRKESHSLTLHTYATHYLYSCRQSTIEKWLRMITLLGFMIPVLIGGIVSSYGLDSILSKWSLIALTPLAIFQLALSAISLVYRWEDRVSYYLESSISNRNLSQEFDKLGKYPNEDVKITEHQYELLIERNNNREEQDDKYPFTDKEMRRGMRYALRRFQRGCSGCQQIPISMKPTDCGVCGQF
ncbi:mobilome CxxCx(11)CxxC protein [Pedobacter miscanthi]|uniref:mobilome CxxCx(11)CxxC protein n=1 Tax=Pedobacter miscanthi TaxID=2259170 RepID=UPI00292F7EF9|nr:mobilome CxxCx(11)CxxC protein [Pedobacter miscanthi]